MQVSARARRNEPRALCQMQGPGTLGGLFQGYTLAGQRFSGKQLPTLPLADAPCALRSDWGIRLVDLGWMAPFHNSPGCFGCGIDHREPIAQPLFPVRNCPLKLQLRTSNAQAALGVAAHPPAPVFSEALRARFDRAGLVGFSAIEIGRGYPHAHILYRGGKLPSPCPAPWPWRP